MRNLTILSLLLSVCFLSNNAFAQHEPGDMVVVIRSAPLKVGEKVLEEIPRGVGLKVQAIQGDWLWVNYDRAGWVSKANVVTPTRAVEIFTDEINRNPHDADAYVARGLAWFDKKEVDIAIADLNEAIRLAPRYSSAYASRSICWWARREVDRAISDISEAIRLEPKDAVYLTNRGILWNMKGEYDKAIEDADAAIRLAPQYVKCHIVRGNALLQKGELRQSLAEFNVAVQIDPKAAVAVASRGRAYAATGEFDRAAADLELAVALDPKSKTVCNELARFYATCPDGHFRNADKALEYARHACELSDWHWASALGVLAAAYAEAGEFDRAVEWQEKATSMVPEKRRPKYLAKLNLYKQRQPYRELMRGVTRQAQAAPGDRGS